MQNLLQKADDAYTKQLEKAIPPSNDKDKLTLGQTMTIHYRKLIGELVYPMVKCHHDYSFHVIKLSQFMANPAPEHYVALLVFQTVSATFAKK